MEGREGKGGGGIGREKGLEGGSETCVAAVNFYRSFSALEICMYPFFPVTLVHTLHTWVVVQSHVPQHLSTLHPNKGDGQIGMFSAENTFVTYLYSQHSSISHYVFQIYSPKYSLRVFGNQVSYFICIYTLGSPRNEAFALHSHCSSIQLQCCCSNKPRPKIYSI